MDITTTRWREDDRLLQTTFERDYKHPWQIGLYQSWLVMTSSAKIEPLYPKSESIQLPDTGGNQRGVGVALTTTLCLWAFQAHLPILWRPRARLDGTLVASSTAIARTGSAYTFRDRIPLTSKNWISATCPVQDFYFRFQENGGREGFIDLVGKNTQRPSSLWHMQESIV